MKVTRGVDLVTPRNRRWKNYSANGTSERASGGDEKKEGFSSFLFYPPPPFQFAYITALDIFGG